MNDLLAKAQAMPVGNKHNYDTIVPVVATLRAKGWTYLAIHQWLRSEGAHIHPHPVTFASAISRRIRNQNKHQ